MPADYREPDRECIFLFSCTGYDPHTHPSPQFIETAHRVTDWEGTISLAQNHRMLPILYAALAAAPQGSCPVSILGELKRRFLVNAIRNAFLLEEIDRLTDILREVQIPAIPFKGPVLAEILYADPSLRQVDDIDFLLRPADIMRASETLIAQGFSPRLTLNTTQREAHIRAGWGCSLQSPKKDYFVELDSGVAADFFSFRMDARWLSDRLVNVTAAGRRFQTLSVENYLLLLCVHGTKHQWSRLVWISDLIALLRKSNIDWPILIKRAETAGARRMLFLGLALARDMGDTELPVEIETGLKQDSVARGLAEQIAGRLRQRGNAESSGRIGMGFHFQVRERLRDRLRYFFVMLIVPCYSDWKSLPLPARLFPLYYLLRPFRLAAAFILGKRRGASG